MSELLWIKGDENYIYCCVCFVMKIIFTAVFVCDEDYIYCCVCFVMKILVDLKKR